MLRDDNCLYIQKVFDMVRLPASLSGWTNYYWCCFRISCVTLPLQVGPAIPSSCGLATSLLERLHSSYKRLRQESYISTLVTNYRSHPDIFELPSSLFYETPLIAPFDRDPPSLHPLYPYPLVFVCSNVNDHLVIQDDNVNEVEAGMLLDEVDKFAIAKNWPTASWGPQDMSHTCIMSPSRPQVRERVLVCMLINSACVLIVTHVINSL